MKPEQLAIEIIKEQSMILGANIARQSAENGGAIRFNSNNIEDITLLQSESKSVIENLVKSYEKIFGQASVEVCLEVMRRFPVNEINNIIPEYLMEKLN